MIKITRAEITKCIIHKVGNKYNSGSNAFSDEIVKFDEESYELLIPFLLKPFTKVTQTYRFQTPTLNKVNKSVEFILNEDNFVANSKDIVTHLYEQSNSAQIKKGDVLVVKFENLEYNNIMTDAVGVFKIEDKVDFFQTYQEEESFDMVVQKGISTKKLDKGCLILNTSDVEGKIVLSVDNNQYDAQYWTNNFLGVQYADNRDLHTSEYLKMCKEFANEIIGPEFGKQEEAIFLNETVDYFKEYEDISLEVFKEEIFENLKIKEQFEEYKKRYETMNDTLIRNNFEVSNGVLKKEKSKFKSEIKLDTNIKISLDVDSPDAPSEYLESGYDKDRKMKFYKVFYNTEK